MKRYLIIIISIILIFTCYYHSAYKETKKELEVMDMYMHYTITLRLDKQCTIYEDLIYYLEKPTNNKLDELVGFIDGIKVFTNSDILNGTYQLALEDTEIIKLLRRLYITTNIKEDIVRKLSDAQIEGLIECYQDLITLFDRGNEYDSITYNLHKEKYDNSKLKSQIIRANNIIDEMQIIFEEIE